MITPEEIRLIIKFSNIESCTIISTYIKGLYIRKYSYIYELDYELEVLRVLERVSNNYNPKLGPLIRYAKNTISLKMKDYIKRNHINTVEMREDIFSLLPESLDSYDISLYSDTVISAIYNVITGNDTKKERDIITSIFKTGE